MTLKEQIDAYKTSFLEKAPKEAVAVMQAATKSLTDSGQAERAVGVGDKAPEFSLKDTAAQTVTLSSLIANGPLVLTFYRGKW
jgi:hypothetical protein